MLVSETQLVTGIAAAFAAMSAVLALAAAATVTPLVLVPAVAFALAAYFMWFHASGRLAARVYAGVEAQATRESRQRTSVGAGPRGAWERPRGTATRTERARRRRSTRERTARQQAADEARARRRAARVLGVEPDADEAAIRSAYRDRIKDVHPDADGGDEAEFKRVREAYEALAE